MNIPYFTTFSKTPTVNEQAVPQPAWLQAPVDDPTPEALALQMDEVNDVASKASRDEWPSEFLEAHGLDAYPPEPLHSEVMKDGEPSAFDAAYLVRMDHPLDLCKLLRTWLASSGVHYRRADIPANSYDFIWGVLGFDLLVGWCILRAFLIVFGIKWTELFVRPEEWFGCNMTRYAEGCPGHPASPAGHGAAAGATAAKILRLLEGLLSADQIRTVVMSGLHFASYRTFAGVHRQHENLRGFVIGWASVDRKSYAEALAEIRTIVPTLGA